MLTIVIISNSLEVDTRNASHLPSVNINPASLLQEVIFVIIENELEFEICSCRSRWCSPGSNIRVLLLIVLGSCRCLCEKAEEE